MYSILEGRWLTIVTNMENFMINDVRARHRGDGLALHGYQEGVLTAFAGVVYGVCMGLGVYVRHFSGRMVDVSDIYGKFYGK